MNTRHKKQTKTNATENRICKKKILARIPNQRIRETVQVKEILIDRFEKRQLIWYGHMKRMVTNGLPQRIWKWKPNKRKKEEDLGKIGTQA